MALGDKLALERYVVFHDAVVYDDDLAPAVHVRVCVGVRRAAVRGPAGVPDIAGRAAGHSAVQRGRQVLQLARLLVHLWKAGSVHDRDSGAVISPVSQRRQAIEQNRRGLLLARITYDSTHFQDLWSFRY